MVCAPFKSVWQVCPQTVGLSVRMGSVHFGICSIYQTKKPTVELCSQCRCKSNESSSNYLSWPTPQLLETPPTSSQHRCGHNCRLLTRNRTSTILPTTFKGLAWNLVQIILDQRFLVLTLLGLFYSLEFLRICSFLVSYLDIEEKKWCKYSWHFIFINKDKSWWIWVCK